MLIAATLALSVPLHFEPSSGPGPAATCYVAAAPRYTLFLSDTGIAMGFPGRRRALKMILPPAPLQALDLLPGKTSYYVGAARSAWRTGVPNYGRVRYHAVFPGVDLVVYGKTQQVEYDWVVAPGADPAAIRFSFTGASAIRVDAGGDLVIETPAGEVRHRKPHIYQQDGGRSREVAGGFVLAGGVVRFRIGEFDHRRALVIDPQLVFAAGFGGNGVLVDFPMTHFSYTDTGTGIATDSDGNVYVVGTTFSVGFPLVNSAASMPPCPSGYTSCDVRSVFVAKIAADGSSLLYSTYIGAVTDAMGVSGAPFSWDYPGLLAAGIALDSAGNVYVTGATTGANFPFTGQASTNGGNDAFVVELSSNGSLVASTLIGGSGDDAGASIAFGPGGFLYLAGTTQSADFPTTAGAWRAGAPASGQNLFLAKIALPALKPVYSTYLGPGDSPAVGVDSSGNAYVGASTTSAAWPTTAGAAQPICAGQPCADVILLKLNPGGSQLLYATYFGGSAAETLGGLAVDALGSVYFSGATGSTDLPTTSGVFQPKWTPNSNYQPKTAFAGKLTPDGRLSYATYLAGSVSDQAQAIAVDSAGNAYVGGMTTSPDFPVVDGIQETLYNSVCTVYSVSGTGPYGAEYCSSAGFLSVMNAQGTGLLWSTYLGSGAIFMGSFGGYAAMGGVQAVALDSAGNVYATGVNLDYTTPPLGTSPTNSIGLLKIGPRAAGLQFVPDGLGSAASFHPGLPAPGGLASLFVRGLSVSGIMTGAADPLPTEVAGVSILVQGTPAPILAVASLPNGAQQINFQTPTEVNSTGASNLVEVRYQGASTFAVPQRVGPGIFLLGDGTPAIQHALDYSLVTPSNPAHKGEAIVIYGSGFGPVSPAIASGVAATGPAGCTCAPYASSPAGPMVVGTVLYAGLTPGYAGLYQVNVLLADNLPSGNLDLYFSDYCNLQGLAQYAPTNAVQSNTVTIPVQ